MNDRNQSNSNSFPPNDSNQSNDNSANTANNDVTKDKSFKAFGRYNPITQDAQTPQPGLTGNQPTGQPNAQHYDPSQHNPYQQQSGYGFPPNAPAGVQPPGKLKHTGLGITSFIFSLVAGLAIVIGIIVMMSGIMQLDMGTLENMSNPAYVEELMLGGGEVFPSEFIGMIAGVFIMLSSSFFAFIGIIFGIISLFIKQRRKVFGILGTVFNGVLLIGGFLFFVFSIAMSGL